MAGGHRQVLELELYPSDGAPAVARAALAHMGLASDTLADAQLVVSELVTNAVRHTRGPAPVVVRYSRHPGSVVIEVIDSGGGFAARPRRPARGRPGGRGLAIVDTLADRWGVVSAERACAWVEIWLSPAGSRVRGEPVGELERLRQDREAILRRRDAVVDRLRGLRQEQGRLVAGSPPAPARRTAGRPASRNGARA